MATVELIKVRKSYQHAEVIHGVDLRIKKGQLVVIVGPSGCGKSTLLRIIAGLESVSSGEIMINDELINDLPPKDRNIAMVFQNYALYPHMSVYDNMAYGLKMRRMSKADIRTRVMQTAKMLQLENFLQRKPRELSGGQRQRVAMGRAMVREPTLFLFDEPLSNLDAKLRVEMRLEIHKLQRSLGITSLYVTHDQVEAMTLADVLVVMKDGEIQQMGKPLEVYQRPETMFVAGFIGTPAMNFFEVDVVNEGSTVLFHHNEIALPTGMLEQYDGRKIILGLRPEVIFIARAEHERTLKLWVELVETLGSDTIVYGYLDHSHKQQIVAKFSGQIQTHPGEFILIAFHEYDLHFFDQETGYRIRS